MTTKIGIISDIHSTLAPLQQSLAIFAQHQVDMIICAGDIAGYGEDELIEVIHLLQQHQCLIISGNHDYLSTSLQQSVDADYITDFFNTLPAYLSLTIEDKRIYVVHAQPPDLQHGGIKLLDPFGQVFPDKLREWEHKLSNLNYDVLIVGHTHQVFNLNIGSVQVINPGSTQFNHSCMILSLPDMQVETFSLGKNEIVKTWNWGIFNRENTGQ